MNCEGHFKHDEIVFQWSTIDPRDGEEEEFCSCPLNFITKSTWDWFAEYKYCKDFPGATLPFNIRTLKWLEAVNIYEVYLHAYQRIANGKPIDG